MISQSKWHLLSVYEVSNFTQEKNYETSATKLHYFHMVTKCALVETWHHDCVYQAYFLKMTRIRKRRVCIIITIFFWSSSTIGPRERPQIEKYRHSQRIAHKNQFKDVKRAWKCWVPLLFSLDIYCEYIALCFPFLEVEIWGTLLSAKW